MLAFVRRKGSADTVSTSPSSSIDGDELLAQQLSESDHPVHPPKSQMQPKKKKRPLSLSLLQRSNSSSSSKESAKDTSAKETGAVAVVADKDAAAATLLTANSSLASHVVWKLAMRMSLHNESRFLQHLSRSMLGMGSPHKHPEKQQESDQPHQHSLKQAESQKLLANSPHKLNRQVDAAASSNPQPAGELCHATPVLTAGGKAPFTPMLHTLPPLPPLLFCPLKGIHTRSRGTPLKSYAKWAFPGLRPGLSIRVVRAEIITSMPAVTEYIVHVEDLHTKVFWIAKKRFHEFYLLRKKIKLMAKKASTPEEVEQLKFILELPFPRRRFRNPSPETISRRKGEIEGFLRNLAALEPSSALFLEVLREFQLEMCSSEFISSLEKIDTTGEPIEPKWLAYDLFLSLNNGSTVEGNTCYKFMQAFANRCVVIEAAVCPECKNFEGKALAAEALKDLRNVVTSIEKYILDNLSPQYADTMSLMDQSVGVQSIIEDYVYHAVEDTLLVPLERQIAFLVSATIDVEMEARLAHNIEKMRGRTQSEFGIAEHLQSEDDWGKSCHYLGMIDERTLPSDKIQELLRSALEIFKSYGEKNLEWRENSALTADDYLPIHIYVVVKSGLKRPLVAKEYLGAMIHPSKMLGEVGYFLTMFEVALKYIADINVEPIKTRIVVSKNLHTSEAKQGGMLVPLRVLVRRHGCSRALRQSTSLVLQMRSHSRLLSSAAAPPPPPSQGATTRTTRTTRTTQLTALAVLEKAPCLQCGSAKPEGPVDTTTTLCAVSGLRLACSRECADTLEREHRELLLQYQSITDDGVYSAGAHAKRLFAEVLTANKRAPLSASASSASIASSIATATRSLSPSSLSLLVDSWEKYLELYTRDEQWLADPRALRLVSAAFSYVMTLSHFLPALHQAAHAELSIHVIGARAEAMMPRHFWEELSFFHPEVTKFDIKLIGDHVPALRKKKQPQQQHSRVYLENINGLYHDPHVLERTQSPPDAFVLFNPGIGHPFLKERWQPTVKSLLGSGKPILLSSFSKLDQERDVAVLNELGSGGGDKEITFLIPPQLNPFRNLKYQIDPLNLKTPIQTNCHVMVVQRALHAQ